MKKVIKKTVVKKPVRKKAQNGTMLEEVTISRSKTGGKKPWASKTVQEKQATRDSIKTAGKNRVENIQLSNARAAGFGTADGGYDKEAYSRHQEKLSRKSDVSRYSGGLNKVNAKGEVVRESSENEFAGKGCTGSKCAKEARQKVQSGEIKSKSGGKMKKKK